MIDVAREVAQAEARIRSAIRETPLEPSPGFGGDTRARVFFKCENLQHTGSFKARGALSKALSLPRDALERGVVTASTGNHGAACAFALARLGAKATIYVPHTASPAKVANIERQGGEIRRHGTDSAETEAFARRCAKEQRLTYLPPYNDPQVVGGQGTIAVELCRQLDDIDAVFVSVGGGGLIAGIAGHLKSVSPRTRIVGCSPENSQVMAQSVKAGRILDLPSEPTLSDGTAGGIEPDSITFPMVRDLVDEHVIVTEAEIAEAMCTFMGVHAMMIEGSAGVAIAGYLRHRELWPGGNVVVVLCGANIALETLRKVLCSEGDLQPKAYESIPGLA